MNFMLIFTSAFTTCESTIVNEHQVHPSTIGDSSTPYFRLVTFNLENNEVALIVNERYLLDGPPNILVGLSAPQLAKCLGDPLPYGAIVFLV